MSKKSKGLDNLFSALRETINFGWSNDHHSREAYCYVIHSVVVNRMSSAGFSSLQSMQATRLREELNKSI